MLAKGVLGSNSCSICRRHLKNISFFISDVLFYYIFVSLLSSHWAVIAVCSSVPARNKLRRRDNVNWCCAAIFEIKVQVPKIQHIKLPVQKACHLLPHLIVRIVICVIIFNLPHHSEEQCTSNFKHRQTRVVNKSSVVPADGGLWRCNYNCWLIVDHIWIFFC